MRRSVVQRAGLVAVCGLGFPLLVAAVATTVTVPALGLFQPEAPLTGRLAMAVAAVGGQVSAHARLGALIGGLAWLSLAERRWASRRGGARGRRSP